MTHSKQVPGDEEAIVSVRLPASLRDRLRAEADTHQRSMSGQVRWLIEKSLAPHRGDATSRVDSDDLRRTPDQAAA